MEKTDNKKKSNFGIADGLDFGMEFDEPITEQDEIRKSVSKAPPKKSAKGEPTEIDPNRSYSKYYTPKPKVGSKGGLLGRGSIAEKDRKVQFSVTCTQEQKERFLEAAQNDHRKLPDFICVAVEEYIRKNNL